MSAPRTTLRLILKFLLALLFVAAGVNHFINPAFYIRIMPPHLPWHPELVFISGVAEIVLGAGLLVPRFQSRAAWGLIALLVAVFPANIHMAVNAHLFPEYPPAILWFRLPFQLAFIGWAYGFTEKRPEHS